MKRSIYGSLIGVTITTLFIAGCSSDTAASKNEVKIETSSLSKPSHDST